MKTDLTRKKLQVCNQTLFVKQFFKIVLMFCLVGFGFSYAYAQNEEITLSLENADVVELIRWASNLTDKNIIIHPNVSGKVTVLAGDPMSRKEAFDVFLSVLQVNSLAIVESDDSLKVVPEATTPRLLPCAKT